jgi:DNA-binding transcriptional regulator YdaS (Cro superfamily)
MIAERLEKFRTRGRIRLSPLAKQMYDQDMHDEIRFDKPGGLADPIVGRGRVHHIRAAAILAAVDGSTFVTPDHLIAAKAIWDYCRSSVAYLWKHVVVAESTGDSKADKTTAQVIQIITEAEDGVTRDEIESHRLLTGGRRAKPLLTGVLQSLMSQGLIIQKKVPTGHPGQPPKKYFLKES